MSRRARPSARTIRIAPEARVSGGVVDGQNVYPAVMSFEVHTIREPLTSNRPNPTSQQRTACWPFRSDPERLHHGIHKLTTQTIAYAIVPVAPALQVSDGTVAELDGPFHPRFLRIANASSSGIVGARPAAW